MYTLELKLKPVTLGDEMHPFTNHFIISKGEVLGIIHILILKDQLYPDFLEKPYSRQKDYQIKYWVPQPTSTFKANRHYYKRGHRNHTVFSIM